MLITETNNFDDEFFGSLTDIVTPVNVRVLERLLKETDYPVAKRNFLVEGFTHGFNIQYKGPQIRQETARNIPFQVGVGNKEEMWEKMMKEVKAKRYAGPFKNIPYNNYIQSPIGLVPKAGGQTRLIFHLSYNFGEEEERKSVNHHTPEDECSVKYNDLDYAINSSFKWENIMAAKQGKSRIFYAKTDLKSAFRILPLRADCSCWLIMRAFHPVTGIPAYFVERNLPFGHSISCFLFQEFSDCLKHIVEVKTGCTESVTNYLDDFLFAAPTQSGCNYLVRSFLEICKDIGVPVAHEKTQFASEEIVFLGILLNGRRFLMTVPEEKRNKARQMLNKVVEAKKATVKELERLTGLLNFLNKAIIPGRTFTIRMYSKYSKKNINPKLRAYHHVRLDSEFREDCKMWIHFLNMHDISSISRPYLDMRGPLETADQILFHSDATANKDLGYGIIFGKSWTSQKWERGFIEKYQPSIEFLELYAVVMGVYMWSSRLANRRVRIFCDNESAVNMINSTSSKTKDCMVLIRYLTIRSMTYNFRIFAQHIRGKLNFLSDSLSRLRIDLFKSQAKKAKRTIEVFPTEPNDELWPLSKFWELNCAHLKD